MDQEVDDKARAILIELKDVLRSHFKVTGFATSFIARLYVIVREGVVEQSRSNETSNPTSNTDIPLAVYLAVLAEADGAHAPPELLTDLRRAVSQAIEKWKTDRSQR